MSEKDSKFPINLRTLRTVAGLSQDELAKKIGVHISSIQHWEAGECMPTLRSASRLADVLNCTLGDLVSDKPLVLKAAKGE